jgi:hypothetical protein
MLYEVMSRNEAKLTAGVTQRLKSSGALHYKLMEEVVLKSRAEDLVEAFINSIKEKPDRLKNYLTRIAEERISEGIFLHEIQIVLQILEEKAWKLVVDFVPQSEQIRCLSYITGTIGTAKDQLAQIYLQHLEKAELKAAFLQRRLDEIAKGTVSDPVDEGVPPRQIQV